MTVDECSLTVPVLVISRTGALGAVRTLDALAKCDERALKNGYYDGLLVFDSAGECYEVRSASVVEEVARRRILIFNHRIVRVALQIAHRDDMTFDEVKATILKQIDRKRDYWEEADDIDDLKATVVKATSSTSIISRFLRHAPAR